MHSNTYTLEQIFMLSNKKIDGDKRIFVFHFMLHSSRLSVICCNFFPLQRILYRCKIHFYIFKLLPFIDCQFKFIALGWRQCGGKKKNVLLNHNMIVNINFPFQINNWLMSIVQLISESICNFLIVKNNKLIKASFIIIIIKLMLERIVAC